MSIEDILQRYDDPSRKGFDYHFITSELGALDDSEKSRPEFQYEMTAFMLVPGSNGSWADHYFGPMFTLTDETGKPFENPSIDSITASMVDYWKKRSEEAHNPLLLTQYQNLVIDFSKSVKGDDVDSSLNSNAVDTIIAIADGCYASHHVVTVKYLIRAFQLCKEASEYKKVKEAFTNFEKKYAINDTSAGLWGAYMRIVIQHADKFTKEEIKEVVARHEERLARLVSRNPNAQNEPALDPFAAEQQATLLADYYTKVTNSQEDVLRVLTASEYATKRCFSDKPASYQLGQLQRIIQTYNAYNIKTENDRLTAEIQRVSARSKKDLERHFVKYELPSEQVDEMINYIMDGDDSSKLYKYVDTFIPKEKTQTDFVRKQAETNPLIFNINNQILDEKGRPSSVIGSIENDLEGHVVLQTSQVMLIESSILHSITQKLKDSGILSPQGIINHLKDCPLFEQDRLNAIKVAIELVYSNQGYIAAHVLIPQIEHAIANLVESCGGSVLNVKKEGKGFEPKTLSQLIDDKSVKTVLSPDAAFYMHVLLTDNRGWNLRNKIVHGLLSVDTFPEYMSERLLHVIVLLGLVRKKA